MALQQQNTREIISQELEAMSDLASVLDHYIPDVFPFPHQLSLNLAVPTIIGTPQHMQLIR